MRNINPGIEVQGQYSGGATHELFTVGELDKVWVLADLYEMDIARVHVGSPAVVTVVAYTDKVFKGKVDWVSGMLDPNTRTAKVRCTFDNPEQRFSPRCTRRCRSRSTRRRRSRSRGTRSCASATTKVVFVAGRRERRASEVRARPGGRRRRRVEPLARGRSTGSSPGEKSSSTAPSSCRRKLVMPGPAESTA